MNGFDFLFIVGFTLIILGFVLSFIAALIMFFRGIRGRRVRGSELGGLVMIGPIPVVFGTSKETVKVLIALSIILIVVALIFMLVLGWLIK